MENGIVKEPILEQSKELNAMFEIFFYTQIIACIILLIIASIAGSKIYGKEYSAEFFKQEMTFIIIFSVSTITSAVITIAHVQGTGFAAIVLTILHFVSYWSSDTVLFLYVHRISIDAESRSKNLYILHFSELPFQEKQKQLKPSVIVRPRVRFWKNFFIISQAVVILAFTACREVWRPEKDDFEILHRGDHLSYMQREMIRWVGNYVLFEFFYITMFVYRTIILITLGKAIYNFLNVDA